MAHSLQSAQVPAKFLGLLVLGFSELPKKYGPKRWGRSETVEASCYELSPCTSLLEGASESLLASPALNHSKQLLGTGSAKR